jgi:hypothetical protein
MRVRHEAIVNVQAASVVPLTALPTVHMHRHARPSGLSPLSPGGSGKSVRRQRHWRR